MKGFTKIVVVVFVSTVLSNCIERRNQKKDDKYIPNLYELSWHFNMHKENDILNQQYDDTLLCHEIDFFKLLSKRNDDCELTKGFSRCFYKNDTLKIGEFYNHKGDKFLFDFTFLYDMRHIRVFKVLNGNTTLLNGFFFIEEKNNQIYFVGYDYRYYDLVCYESIIEESNGDEISMGTHCYMNLNAHEWEYERSISQIIRVSSDLKPEKCWEFHKGELVAIRKIDFSEKYKELVKVVVNYDPNHLFDLSKNQLMDIEYIRYEPCLVIPIVEDVYCDFDKVDWSVY